MGGGKVLVVDERSFATLLEKYASQMQKLYSVEMLQ